MISFYKKFFVFGHPDLKDLTDSFPEGALIRINGSREVYEVVFVEFVKMEYSYPGFYYIFKILVCPCKFRDIKVDGLNLK